MMEMPGEVKAYFESGRRKICQVIPNADYSLTLTFDNGEVRMYCELQDKMDHGVFAKIRPRFSAVFIDEDTGCVAWDIDPDVDSRLVWNNRVTLCPDACYVDSRKITE